MNVNEFDGILQKLSDLKVFFDYGEKTLPLLEEVTVFARQIEPVIEGMRSLVDVTTQKLPRASEQLDAVNRSSETASTDVLNTVDRMMTTLEHLQRSTSVSAQTDIILKTADKMDALVRTVAARCPDIEDMKELNNTWDMHRQTIRFTGTATPSDSITSLKDDCTSIMLSMQMQDITGQQIATVIGTMQALDDLLRKLLAEVFDILHATVPPTEPVVSDPMTATVGIDERKRMVEALLQKARAGDLLEKA